MLSQNNRKNYYRKNYINYKNLVAEQNKGNCSCNSLGFRPLSLTEYSTSLTSLAVIYLCIKTKTPQRQFHIGVSPHAMKKDEKKNVLFPFS